MEQKEKTPRELFLETLTNLGCPYNLADDGDDEIFFHYQGESFIMSPNDGRRFISICKYAWDGVELDDIEEVVRLRKAINEANWRSGVTSMFSIDEDDKIMNVHCKSMFYFSADIPCPEVYLSVVLKEFFKAHHIIEGEMAKLRAIEGAASR